MGHIRSKTKGIIVYNFDSYVKKKCVDGGILNERAINSPVLGIPSNLKIKRKTEIRVRVLVDSLSGKVIAAHTITGNPIVRSVFETAAKNATFSPFHHGQGVFVKGIIVYKIKLNGEVEFPKTPKKDSSYFMWWLWN